MYGTSQTRTQAYVPRNLAHQHTASAAAAYPYAAHRPPPEGYAHGASRSVSPTVLRSRPRAGTSAAAIPPLETNATGLSARGARPHNSNAAYNMNMGANAHNDSPSRPRSRSQTYSQNQSRSRSSHPQPQMNPYPYAQKPNSTAATASQRQYMFPGSHTYAGEDGRVLLDMDAFRRSLERDGPPAPHNNYDSRARAGYAPGSTESASRNYGYAHGSGIPDIEWRRPAPGEVPPGYEHYVQPVARAPPAVPSGAWPRSSASSHAMQMTGDHGRGAHLPPRPPSPASHYPFANYTPPDERNAYGERASERREGQARDRRASNARDGYPPPLHAAVAAASQADSTSSDPLIHNALGWWPDQRRPALHWDLSSSTLPRYTKRTLDAEELASSPFTPPLSRMRLVLDPRTQWSFDLVAPRGQRYITLSSLLSDIANLMRAPNKVPHAFWVRASLQKKEAVLRAMLRRTGRTLPPIPPHRRPKPRGQIMEEAVVDGAPNGYTNLLVIDLLCEDVMFAGMEFHKEPDEWVLRTMRRY